MRDTRGFLDTSKPSTFDAELLVTLQENHDLIRDYLIQDRETFETYDDYYGPGRTLSRPDNPHHGAFQAFQESLSTLMETKVIRGFHYTRMTDAEVEILCAEGIRLSTPSFLQTRLGYLTSAGFLTNDEVRKIMAESPFKTQLKSRQNRFWMVSSRLHMHDGRIKPLLATWGGEVASMHLTDHDLVTKLQSIGCPRMFEVAVPLAATNRAYLAACAVVASYALQHEWPSEGGVFSFYVRKDLPADALLQVFTQREF